MRGIDFEASSMTKRCCTLLLTGLISVAVSAKTDHFLELGGEAAKLRGLSYRPVPAQALSQKECSDYLLRLLDKEMKPIPTKRQESFLKLIGLMPQKASMKKILAELYTDQVRGLYDPEKKRYIVVKGGGNSSESNLGAGLGLNMEDILTVHELTHAIQDQHFDLASITRSVTGDSDREIAAQTLIEGDASILMLDWALNKMGMAPGSVDPSQMPGLNGEEMMMGQSAALARAPRYFKEMLGFPYSQGMVLVTSLRRRGGWKNVDQAYAHLPESSEQVIHPEKIGRDHPKSVTINGANLTGSLGQDTAGEFTVRVWAREMGASDSAASGWGGDRYEVFDGPSGACAVWATDWDSERDAKEFEELAIKGLNKRWGKSSRNGLATEWNLSGLKHCQVVKTGTQVDIRLGCPGTPPPTFNGGSY